MKFKKILAFSMAMLIMGGAVRIDGGISPTNIQAEITEDYAVTEFLNSGYDRKNITVYDGTDETKSFKMMGKTYTQGICMDDKSNPNTNDFSTSYISFNVEDIDSVAFTIGHRDDSAGYDGKITIYLDNEVHDTIICSWTMNIMDYSIDTSDASTLRIHLDDKSGYRNNDSHFGLADFRLNGNTAPKNKVEYDGISDFINSGYDRKNITTYDGTDETAYMQMMGKKYVQGFRMDDNRNANSSDYSTSYMSFNVENIDSFIFTLGHIDDTNGHNAILSIYIDNELYYKIDCTTTMNIARYKFSTANASAVRFYLDDTSAYRNNDSHYGLANIVLNEDFSMAPEGSYKDPSKIIDLDVFYTPTENDNEMQIDNSVSIYNGHSYKAIYDSSITSWKDAQAYCESLGGHLATISDEQEQNFVLSIIEKTEDADWYWLGGYYTRLTDTWAWVDKTTFSYNNWSEGAPDFYENNEYCLEIAAHDNKNGDQEIIKGKWNDNKNEPEITNGFVCEWDGEPAFLLGDVTLDGIINGSDATITLNAYTIISSGNPSPLNDVQTKAADVDRNGIITGSDATLILRYYTMLSSVTDATPPSLEEWMENQ